MFMRLYGATWLPTHVLIGKDGSVVQQCVGEAIKLGPP
jgi:hypothetical protein